MSVVTNAGTINTPLWTQASRTLVAYVCQAPGEHNPDARFAETHERLVAFLENRWGDEDEHRIPQTGWPSVVAKEGSD